MQSAKRVLLISSCGGHWVQMSCLAAAFDGHDVFYASTEQGYAQSVPDGKFFYVPDASRSSGVFSVLRMVFGVLWVLLKLRPQVVLTTGAAPGFCALLFAKLLGMKTIWVDSIANVKELSMSGRKVARFADLYITQWEHLAKEGGPQYFGSVV